MRIRLLASLVLTLGLIPANTGADEFRLHGVRGSCTDGGETHPFVKVAGYESDEVLRLLVRRDRAGEDGSSVTVRVGLANYPTCSLAARAIPGVDFIATNIVVRWEAGDVSTGKTVEIPIIFDNKLEDTEIFNAFLENPSEGSTLDRLAHVAELSVVNSPRGEFRFAQTSFSANASEGKVAVQVERFGSNRGAVSIRCGAIVIGSDTAVPHVTFETNYVYRPEDYYSNSALDPAPTGPAPGYVETLTWEDGESGNKEFLLRLKDHPPFSTTETLHVVLFEPRGGATISYFLTNRVAIVGIQSTEAVGLVKFGSTEFSFDEDSLLATIPVERVGGKLGKISVDWHTRQTDPVTYGYAAEGEDYQKSAGVLSWADGDDSVKTLSIPLMWNSDSFEPALPTYRLSEVFQVVLEKPTGGTRVVPTGEVALIRILDTPGPFGIVKFSKVPQAIHNFHGALPAEYLLPASNGFIQVPILRASSGRGAIATQYRVMAIDKPFDWENPDEFSSGYDWWGRRLNTGRPGIDFAPTNGVLRWADGDSRTQFVRVQILATNIPTTFDMTLDLSGLEGGAVYQMTQVGQGMYSPFPMSRVVVSVFDAARLKAPIPTIMEGRFILNLTGQLPITSIEGSPDLKEWEVIRWPRWQLSESPPGDPIVWQSLESGRTLYSFTRMLVRESLPIQVNPQRFYRVVWATD